MKVIAFVICFLLVPFLGFSQNGEMADAMRQSGKIYVVVAVIAVIFIGLAIYLFTLDKKISKIEKQSNKNQ
ncbi:MAG TPA: CcmD family protein [Anseongella sp.]